VTRESRDDPSDDDKKERVLHTRVPPRLEAELKERAADLGVSVSNLVRNVLTHAFGLVGDVVADSAQVVRSASGAGGTPRPVGAPAPAPASTPRPASDDVIGWQPIVLAKNAVCAACNDILPRGSDGALGITDGGARPIVCARCLEEIRHGRDLEIDERSEAMGGGSPAGFAGRAEGKAPRGIDE